MSDLVPAEDIERIVGADRHWSRHIGRADSETQTVFILHSGRCKTSGIDLRACSYSRLLDMGINSEVWADWQDEPVVLGIGRAGLIPMRLVADHIETGETNGE